VEVLAVIPARGGSKGIPGKNLQTLGGRPLIAYSCEAALAARQVTRAIVSTDDAEIGEVARRFGVQVPFLRPARLAGDETPMLDVVQHVLAELDRTEAYAPDVVVLLQPTSPLRTAAHVDAAVEELKVSGADSVVTVVAVPHLFNPTTVLRVEHGRLVPFLASAQRATRRQDKPRVFARNGPAVLAARTAVVKGGSLYGSDSRPILMSAEESVDIDEPFDLELAEWLLARRARWS
jgi:CMP-N-acetylneuraminic acid synthetase